MKREIEQKVKVFALGGLGEFGKNMYVVEHGSDIFVIDGGMKFPEDEMLGIDIVIPDTTYLKENKHRIKGIFLTHGHEDHIGGLPYILPKLDVPVYGTRLTLGLVIEQLKQANVTKRVKLKQIDENSELKFDDVTISFFRTTHNIPDSVGICVETPQGSIVYTGDFKFDQTPIDGKGPAYERLAEISKKGVLCLLSDSTHAEVPGFSASESVAAEELASTFYNAKGRMIVSLFATNINRIQQIVNASLKTNRKIAFVGRAMNRVADLAQNLGYLQIPNNAVIPVEEISQCADDKVTIITSGHKGEPLKALTRIAQGTHKQVAIQPGDTVVIAATPVPGTEKLFSKTIDQLFRAGAYVVYGQKRVHVPGHAFQEELKLMLHMLKPRYFMPVHGEFRNQKAHGVIAQSLGLNQEAIFLIDNGDILEFHDGDATVGGRVPAGNVLIDGLGIGDVGNIVLRDRRLLSQDGILLVVVTLSKKQSVVISGPEILSRGFVYVREAEKLMEQSVELVSNILEQCMQENIQDWSTLKLSIRESLSHFLFEKTKRRPMILPIIMEI
ncbi:ribonuclease J [Bacillus tianshenii]|nr:ribonuclease J [Bacillus tianshenii]